MHTRFMTLTPEVYAYLVAHRSPSPSVLEALTEETARLGGVSRMQIAGEQGAGRSCGRTFRTRRRVRSAP